MTLPALPPEYVPAWAVHVGQPVLNDAPGKPGHVVTVNEACRDGRHLVAADGWETVCGWRHGLTVTPEG